MSVEEKIIQALLDKFPFLNGKLFLRRQRRISLEIAGENFAEVFAYAVKGLGFGHLCMITGLDEGDFFAVIYHLSSSEGIILNIKLSIKSGNPAIKTITADFPGADAYEREIADLFGIRVEGLAPGHRYPLTDEWPQDEYPLRKGWKAKTPG
jgi:NADH:ubiquinone oxidoreductase subunit C